MNDERDHDTEHIEKIFGLGNRKKQDNDNVEDSSATHNSTDGVANPDAGKGTAEGWGDDADGKVDDPKTTGKKKKNPFSGFGEKRQQKKDYEDYRNLTSTDLYSPGVVEHSPETYAQDDLDESGAPKWRAHYEQVKENKKKRDAFAEEYRKNTGRDFNRKGVNSEYPLSWEAWEKAYGEGGYARGENGEIDWDKVNRDIARGYVHNYVNGLKEGDEQWVPPDDYADTARYYNAYDDADEEFAEFYGITNDQLMEAYWQFGETGQIDPSIFVDKDTPREEAEQIAEQVEERAESKDSDTSEEKQPIVDESFVPMSDDERYRYTGEPIKGGPNGETLNDNFASKQQAWKPSVTSQRMMDAGLAGLNMFGGIMGGANKAFSMLRGLASALTSRQLMSDPTLPARGFLNAMEQSGQIVEDHIRQVGEAYGIKDGVKRDDLVGTYKGAQYYREKQQIENAEKQYYAGVGNALSAVLGNNVDVNDTVGIQNALAQMTPQQLSQLDDALFGRNGSLKDMYEATVVNPMGSTREQKARAQLLTTLNQSLKGQAQANAREAGRQRTQANQQIQQYNQENRRLKIGQEKDIANSNQLLNNPQAMASMTDDAQMEVFVNAVLGRRVNSKQIPTNQNGEVEIDKLGSSDLNHLREVLSRPEFQNLSGARKLRANVVSRLEAIKQSNAQYNQAYRQSQFAQYANSPLDIDLDRRKGLDRDNYGIPNSSKGREGLMNRAYMIRDDLVSNGGSQKDIDLCDNAIMMCRMANLRDDLMGRIDRLEKKGAVSPLLAEHLRNEAQSAYRRLNDHLAVSYDERERRIRSNLPWSQSLNSDIIRYEMGGINSSLDRMETDLNNARQAPRMAELAKIEEKERAEAALDDRGVPRGLQVYRNRMRKALNGNLASIETEMATLSMNSPEDHFRRMALAQEKLNIEQQLLRVGQEDHIQKMLSDARAHGLGDQAEAAADRLRERYSDWNEFGEALNQERRAMGMPDDTKWNATASAQRAQGLQNQTQALINAIGSLEQAMKGQPGAMKDMLKDFLGDKDVLEKVKKILHENNIDLKHEIIGKGNIKMHGVVVNAIKDAFKKDIQKKITGMFQTAVSNTLNPVTDRLTNIQSAVSDLGDAQKSGIISAVNGVNTSLRGVRDMLTQCLKDSATGQPIKVEELRNSLNSYMQSNLDLINKLNEKIPLGGTNDDKYGIPSDVLEQLQNNQEAIKTQNENLESLVRKLDAGMVTREELADVVDKLSKVAEKEPSGTELDSDGNSLTQLRNKIEDMIDKGGYVLGFISNFAKDREAQGLDPAVPIVSLEDPMNSFQAFFETLANKVEEDAMNSEQDQNEAPSGAAYDNARNDASETGQETVSEATEPKEGEIYENRYVDPNTGVYTPPAEKPVDPAGKVDMAVDELLDSLPALKEYTSKNPETLKFLRSEGPNGAVHQTLRDAAEKAERNELFDGHAANVVLSMMDDLLSQTSRPQFKNTVKDWLQIADSQGDAQQVTDQRGVVQNIATMAETALEGVFQRDLARRLSMPPENVSEGTGETDPEAESIRRGLRIMEESLIEAQELASQGLDEGQIKQKMAESQAEQQRVAEAGTKAIVPEQDSEVGKRMAESVRNTLFYSKKGPQWADYRSVMDRLADMRSKYPQATEEIDKVREDIVLGMVVPQLMGFKNVANVAPSDKMTMDKIKEISRRAMEIGPTMWQDFPTMDELVDSHIYGKNKPEDPININRARVHRQEGGNRINNRLGEAFRAAAKDITLNDLAQSKLEDIRNNNLYSKFQNQIAQVGAGADKLPSADDLWARYKDKDEGLTIADVNTTLGSYKSAIANASDLKKKIEDYLSKNGLPKEVSNEYGKMEVPQEILQQMENARADHAKAAGMGDLDKFFAEGDVSKQLLSLEALKEQMYEDDLKKNYGFDDKTVKEIIDKAHKKAGDSGNYEAHLGKIADTVVKERKKAEKAEHKAKKEAEAKKRFEDNSDSAKAKLEEIRNGLLDPKVKSAMDGVQRLEGEDDRKFLFERTVTGLRQIFKDNASLSAAGEALGLKEPGTKDWNINAPNPFTYIANALINGSGKLTDRKYDSVWPPKEETSDPEPAETKTAETQETPVEEEKDVNDAENFEGIDPLSLFGAGDFAVVPEEEKEEVKKSVIGNNLLEGEDLF